MKKYIYDFGKAGYNLVHLLGGKGAGLGEMVKMGLNVPPGFTITTEAGKLVEEGGYSDIQDHILLGVKRIEKKTNRNFGEPENPLLLSVRSGAPVSMPGIMETILNVGINEEIAKSAGSEFYFDCYERLIRSFGKYVLGEKNDDIKGHFKKGYCDPGNLKHLSARERIEKEKYLFDHFNVSFPESVEEQLHQAVQAVFRSWYSPKAESYKEIENISDDLGTAVNVQAMVFGNLNKKSSTAVFFTRNPCTGEKGLFGSYIKKNQGDELVNGGNGGIPIHKIGKSLLGEFKKVGIDLENRLGDMQEVEATIQNGAPFYLQTRPGKRTNRAAVRILLDLAKEGKISEEDVIRNLDQGMLENLTSVEIDPKENYIVAARGTPVSDGIICGYGAQNKKTLLKLIDEGKSPILLRTQLETEDIELIDLAKGILTEESDGNTISHALVVARGKNKCCVTGCSDLTTGDGYGGSSYFLGEKEMDSSSEITLNGYTGEVIRRHVNVVESKADSELDEVMKIIKKYGSGNPFLVKVRNPNEAARVSPPDGILYAGNSFFRERPELEGAIKRDKEALNSIREKQIEEYIELFDVTDENCPIVFSLFDDSSLINLLSTQEIFKVRRKYLTNIVKDMGDHGKLPEEGDIIKYNDQKVKIIHKICENCGRTNIKYMKGENKGKHNCVSLPYSFDEENTIGDIRFRLEQINTNLEAIPNMSPGLIRALQKKVIKNVSRKNKERSIFMLNEIPDTFFINKVEYSVGDSANVYYEKLKEAKKVLGQ